MHNFEFYCPTRVVFGKDTIKELSRLIDKSKKVLILYGGGSIKKNGVYDQVISALKEHDFTEFSGIEPNPTYETCMQAVRVIKNENIDFLLAVGGGSVLDGTKFIAAAAKYEGNEPYDIVTKALSICDALPIGDVITLPATGSEMNKGAVISRKSTNEKLSFMSDKVYPVFSIIDPQTTFSLPEKQTINGIIDTFVHTLEQYCTYDVNTPLQDSWMLGLLKTLIKETPKVLANPNDYDARANIFWCATCGLNYFMSTGCVQDWSTHMIGHELTAFYGIDHGQSLAIVLPRLYENQIDSKREKLEKLGCEVFGLNEKNALKTIHKIEEFFNSIGMKTRLTEYGIDAEDAAIKIKDRFISRSSYIGERGNIDGNIVYDILIKA